MLARGYTRQRSGNFDAALADFNRAIELDPKNAFAVAARGGVRNDQKAWSEAINDFDQSITLRQDYAAAYVGRARAAMEIGQLDSAMADLNTAISINAGVPNAFFWRGQAYRRKGDMDRAIAQNPQNDRAPYMARGQLFSAKGDYTRAFADFDRALALAPDDKTARQLRQSAIAMQTELAKVRIPCGSPEKPRAMGLASKDLTRLTIERRCRRRRRC